MAKFVCDHCGLTYHRPPAQRNRPGCTHAYCGRRCSGLARRVKRTRAERKELKASYDAKRRAAMGSELRKAKRQAYRVKSLAERQAIGRAARQRRDELHGAGSHTVYCREYFKDPKRKAAKVLYDQSRRDLIRYGCWAECAYVLRLLNREIKKAYPSTYERLKARGYYERSSQQRRRDAQISRW